jgi:hypothetical protein
MRPMCICMSSSCCDAAWTSRIGLRDFAGLKAAGARGSAQASDECGERAIVRAGCAAPTVSATSSEVCAGRAGRAASAGDCISRSSPGSAFSRAARCAADEPTDGTCRAARSCSTSWGRAGSAMSGWYGATGLTSDVEAVERGAGEGGCVSADGRPAGAGPSTATSTSDDRPAGVGPTTDTNTSSSPGV